MTILGVCGSLQRQSANLALLNAATAAAPPDVEVVVFDGLGELPHFNPDIEASGVPESVMRWRRALAESDAVLVASPEVRFQSAWELEERHRLGDRLGRTRREGRGDHRRGACAGTWSPWPASAPRHARRRPRHDRRRRTDCQRAGIRPSCRRTSARTDRGGRARSSFSRHGSRISLSHLRTKATTR